MSHVVLLPGDGIGPEVVGAAVRVLDAVSAKFSLHITTESKPMGGAALAQGLPALPPDTLDACRKADAVLLGAVGDPAYDHLPSKERPEGGLLAIRKGLGVYANLRPAKIWPGAAEAGPLKTELAAGADLLIVRELTGGLYFGEPRGFLEGGTVGYNTMRYSVFEVERIARVAFEAKAYPDVAVSHMYVDACAMALVTGPKRFDVILTENLFGDILSDEAAVIAGSIGLLPSASLGDGPGLYEPVHGSAPDIAGRDIANPVGAIASLAMLLTHSLRQPEAAAAIERALEVTLAAGHRTADLGGASTPLGTRAFTDRVIGAI
jgi:3-isopropylmalate dehydrogenase